MGSGIGGWQHIVKSVAVITRSDGGCRIWFAQRHSFAVIRFAVMFQTVCVTFAATFVAGGFEIITRRIYDLMRAVTVNTDRPAFVAHGEQLAVNALVVSFLNAHVAFAARLGYIGVIDGRITIHAALDAVRAVTIVARWRDYQTHLQQRVAVDAVHVLVRRLGNFDLIFFREIRVAVTLRARRWQI